MVNRICLQAVENISYYRGLSPAAAAAKSLFSTRILRIVSAFTVVQLLAGLFHLSMFTNHTNHVCQKYFVLHL